jgi:hypothetical protein
VFDTELNRATNSDTIVDFNVRQDSVYLEARRRTRTTTSSTIAGRVSCSTTRMAGAARPLLSSRRWTST